MLLFGMSSDEVLAEALQLTRPERARVADELLRSLEETNEAVAEAWARELDRRSRELADGSVVGVPWDQVREELKAELEARRAGGATSTSEG